jgi:hypothetical protein
MLPLKDWVCLQLKSLGGTLHYSKFNRIQVESEKGK